MINVNATRRESSIVAIHFASDLNYGWRPDRNNSDGHPFPAKKRMARLFGNICTMVFLEVRESVGKTDFLLLS